MKTKTFKNKQIEANGSKWTISGSLITDDEGSVEVKINKCHGCVNDTDGRNEAVQNWLIDGGLL